MPSPTSSTTSPAPPQVDTSWHNVAPHLATNALGTHHVLRAVRRLRRPCRVLIVTSAQIYQPGDDPISESAPLLPPSPYGLSKLAQDQLALHAAARRGHGRRRSRARSITRARARTRRSRSPSFARQIARIEAGLAPPIIRVGNLDARRDLTDVRDVADAYDPHRRSRAARTAVQRLLGPRVADRRPARRAAPPARRPRFASSDDPARMRPNDVPVLQGNAARARAELELDAPHPHRADPAGHARVPGGTGRDTKPRATGDPPPLKLRRSGRLDRPLTSHRCAMSEHMAKVPCSCELFLGVSGPTLRDVAECRARGRHRGTGRRETRRHGALPGSPGAVRSGRRPRDAVPLGAQPLPRLHPRVRVLLRAEVPAPSRARRRRRLLVADSRQDEPAGGAAARGRPARVDARDRGGRHRHGSLSAHRGPLPHHAAVPRSVDRLRDAVLDRDEGPDGGERRRRARTGDGGRGLRDLHERADGRRGGVGEARTGHGAAAPAAARVDARWRTAGSTPPC